MTNTNNPRTEKEQRDLLRSLKTLDSGGNGGGDSLVPQTTSLPGMGTRLLAYEYTSESEIRQRVAQVARSGKRKLTQQQLQAAGVAENPLLAQARPRGLTEKEREALMTSWCERLIEQARKRGRLMTDRQLADWQVGRRLTQGDRVRYIGPDREEQTQAMLIVPRPHGQEGFISSVSDTRDGRILTFHPFAPVAPVHASEDVDAQFVDLQVREYTPGWLLLERIEKESA